MPPYHLFLEIINSITSGLIKFIFTSLRGVVKNPQFWAQFCRASVSDFRRYFLKNKVPKCWTVFEKGQSSKPYSPLGNILHIFNAH